MDFRQILHKNVLMYVGTKEDVCLKNRIEAIGVPSSANFLHM